MQDDRVRFTPDEAWLAAGQHPPLGLAFLQSKAPRTGVDRRRLPIWFENLLPERGSRLRSWLCRQCEIPEVDSAALLSALGGDLVGAVEIRGGLAHMDEQAAKVHDVKGQLRFSLAGMQLKLSMLMSGDRFVFPARDQSGRWIVKIPGENFPDLPDVEAATMAWARLSGL